MDLLQALQNRNSAPKLTDPAPDGGALEQIFAAGLRTPDHAWLTPWRFTVVKGERRKALGEVFLSNMEQANKEQAKPELTEQQRAKLLNAPLRGPLIIIVSAVIQEHPNVPEVEQLLSAGCAAQNMLLAAEATGYAGIWRTGPVAYTRGVMNDLGMEPNEQIVGYLYLGTREGKAKNLPERRKEDFIREW